MEIITRLSDNAELTISGQTALISAEGVYSFSRNRGFSADEIGGSVAIDASIAQKVFSLVFASGDSSGIDQRTLSRFFASDAGLYRLYAPNLGFDYIDFYVVSLDAEVFNGSNVVNITCQARYGDFVEEEITTLHSGTINSGGSALATTSSFTNNRDQTQTVRVVIESPVPVTWRANIGVGIRKGGSSGPMVYSFTGANDDQGNRTTFRGLRYVLDSWKEITDGEGVILSGPTTFWNVKPGEAVTVHTPSFLRPINESRQLNLRVEAVLLKQKTTV